MPFEQLIPRPLRPAAVRVYAPIASGVYGISNASEWIYIGETDDIQGTLLAHLRESSTPPMMRQPTGFVFEICDRARRSSRQDSLVTEYQPCCNEHLSRHP